MVYLALIICALFSPAHYLELPCHTFLPIIYISSQQVPGKLTEDLVILHYQFYSPFIHAPGPLTRQLIEWMEPRHVHSRLYQVNWTQEYMSRPIHSITYRSNGSLSHSLDISSGEWITSSEFFRSNIRKPFLSVISASSCPTLLLLYIALNPLTLCSPLLSSFLLFSCPGFDLIMRAAIYVSTCY